MSKYLRTSGISAALEDLIKEAKEKLYIISPYLKLSDQIKELLNDKEREKIDVRIIFGKQELNPTEMEYLETLKYIRLFFSKNLHAKCYLNENKMIITSMNLYEFSQKNNKEMGVLIDKNNEVDKQVYEDAWKDIDSILHNAEDFAYTKSSKAAPSPSSKYDTEQHFGYCIRTGAKIPFDIYKPMTLDAYKTWEKYGNFDFPEKYCHFSGEASYGETSKRYPVLSKNLKQAQEIFGVFNFYVN